MSWAPIIMDLAKLDEPLDENKTLEKLEAYHHVIVEAFDRHPPRKVQMGLYGMPNFSYAEPDVLRLDAIRALNLDDDEEVWTSPWQATVLAIASGVPGNDLVPTYTLLFL